MGRRRRVLIVKIPEAALADIDRFFERLSKAIGAETAIMRVSRGAVRIEFFGSEAMAKEAIARVRRLLREYSVREEVRGYREIPARLLYREAGLAVPLDVVEHVLRSMGRDARAGSSSIVTNADLEEVVGVARTVAEAVREAGTLYATRTAKKAVAAAAAITGRRVLEVLDAGLETGVLEEDDEGKLFVRGDWRVAVKRLVEALEGEGGAGLGEWEPEDGEEG